MEGKDRKGKRRKEGKKRGRYEGMGRRKWTKRKGEKERGRANNEIRTNQMLALLVRT